MEALEGEDVTEVSSWSILLLLPLLPEMKSSSIWSMHCRRWSWKEEAIRGHLGDYNEAGSFVSHGQDTKPCVRPICFISLTNNFFRWLDWELNYVP